MDELSGNTFCRFGVVEESITGISDSVKEVTAHINNAAKIFNDHTLESLQANDTVLRELSDKVASLKTDFGGLRDHVHIEYPSQSDRITDLGKNLTKLNAKVGFALDPAVGPLRHIETLIPQFTAYDTRLDAAEARLSSAISEWGDAHHENTVTHDLDRQLPECKVWQSLLKSFDDLEDNITNEVHELKELSLCTQSTSSSVAGTPGGIGPASSCGTPTVCKNYSTGKCKRGEACPDLHIIPGYCTEMKDTHQVDGISKGLRQQFPSGKGMIGYVNYMILKNWKKINAGPFS
jgi:hypothetical protein